jgi:glycosyltransferase involved in cell wall biosynthesis
MGNMHFVFIPISYSAGMAGNQRIKNLKSLLLAEGFSCSNIIIRKEISPEDKHPNTTHINYKKTSLISILRLPFLVYRTLKKHKQKNKKNILYHTGYPSIQNRYVFRLAKILSYKIVFDITENNYAIKTSKNIIQKIRIKSSRYYFKRIHTIADGVIHINENLYDLMKEKIKTPPPLLKIPISINPNEFSQKKILPNKHIFYGGSFGPKDGLKYLIQAFDTVADIHKDCRLIITGKASSENWKEFQKHIDSIKNKEKIILKGYLKRADYVKTLQDCFIHCVTRDKSDFAQGGFPFKLGEMLMTGNPVICSKVGEVGNYLSNKENAFLIESQSSTAIIEAILYIIDNPESAVKIGQEGKNIAIEHFTLTKIKKEIINFLEQI